MKGLEYDEFGQGYMPGTCTLIVCVCGEVRESGDWSGHYCPYDEPVDDTAGPASLGEAVA